MNFVIKKSSFLEINKSLKKPSLDELKKEIIEILKKKESQEYKKAIEYFNQTEKHYTHIEKSLDGKWIEKSGYGVGTVRIWRGKKYKKVSTSPARWVRVFDKMDRGAKSSMTRLIHKVENCKTEEELYQFCMSNHSLFQDANGVDLPIMDKLRAAIDNKSNGFNGSISKKEIKPIKNIIDIINHPEKSSDKELKDTITELQEQLSVAENQIKNEYGTYVDKKIVKDNPEYIKKLQSELNNRSENKEPEKTKKSKTFSDEEINSRIEKGKELYEKYKSDYSNQSEDAIINDLMRYVGYNLSLDKVTYASNTKKTTYKPMYSETEKKEGEIVNTNIENKLRDYIKGKNKEHTFTTNMGTVLTESDIKQKIADKKDDLKDDERRYNDFLKEKGENHKWTKGAKADVETDKKDLERWNKWLEAMKDGDIKETDFDADGNKKESVKETYWIQDSKGNRLTNESAKKRILNSLNEMDKIHSKMDSMETADKVAAQKDIRMLGNDIENLISKLKPDDSNEMETERQKYIEKVLNDKENKKESELNISDSEINSITDVDYLKELQKKVVKENNRLHSEKKYDLSNDMARRVASIFQRIKQLESEAEKHQNRSEAMKGNKNAWKGGIKTENLINFVKQQTTNTRDGSFIDITPYIDDEESTKKYVNIRLQDMSKTEQAKIKEIAAKNSDKFTLSDNGGLGTAFIYGKDIENVNSVSKNESNKVLSNRSQNKDKNIKEVKGKLLQQMEFMNNAEKINAMEKLIKREGERSYNGIAAKEIIDDIEHGKDLKTLVNNFIEDSVNNNLSLDEFKEQFVEKWGKESADVYYDAIEDYKKKIENKETENIDDKKIITENRKSGENEVELKYSKDVSDTIKSLSNCISTDKNRLALSKVYYDGENLVATDGRRLKTVNIGKLDGIPENSYIDISNNNNQIKLKKYDFKTDYPITFPNYKKVIPENNNQKVSLDNKSVINIIKRLKKEGAINKDIPYISLDFENGKVLIDGEIVGNADNIKLVDNRKNEVNNIVVNADYLLNGLSGDNSNLMLGENATRAMVISTNATNDIIMPTSDNIKPNYEMNRQNKTKKDEQKNENKKQNKDFIESYINSFNFTKEKIDKVYSNIDNAEEEVIKRSIKELNDAEKLLNNPPSNSMTETKLYNNRYGFQLLAMVRQKPEFKLALQEKADEYGIEYKKSLFDFIDIIDEDEHDDIEEEFVDNDYMDYDATQPELFNTISYKVAEAIKCCCKNR